MVISGTNHASTMHFYSGDNNYQDIPYFSSIFTHSSSHSMSEIGLGLPLYTPNPTSNCHQHGLKRGKNRPKPETHQSDRNEPRGPKGRNGSHRQSLTPVDNIQELLHQPTSCAELHSDWVVLGFKQGWSPHTLYVILQSALVLIRVSPGFVLHFCELKSVAERCRILNKR